MLTVVMNQNHSTPFSLGTDGFEQLAPPRVRSTSPSHRPTGMPRRAQTRERNGDEVRRMQAPSGPGRSYASYQSRAMPTPARPTSRQSASANLSSGSGDQNQTLQPRMHSSRHQRTDGSMLYTRAQGDLANSTASHLSITQAQSHHSNHPPQYSVNPPRIEEPPRSHSAVPGQIRNTSHISSSSSAPASPWYSSYSQQRPESRESQRPPTDHRRSTFATPDHLGLFAQALTGLGPELQSSGSPSAAMSDPNPRPHNRGVPGSGTEQRLLHSVSIGPEPVRGRDTFLTASRTPSPMLSDPSTSHRPAFDMAGSPLLESPQAAFHHDLALSGALSGLDIGGLSQRSASDNDDGMNAEVDDELPDYEQSQREAADQARFKALRRARELESRWAASSPHQMR